METEVKLEGPCGEHEIDIIRHVEGNGGCYNDVVLCYGRDIQQHVIFFPGDVQDFTESMMKHRDNFRWAEYCLENTAKILLRKFDKACIWIVRCSRMHFSTFSCYENFLKTNMFGVPTYNDKEQIASRHLNELFHNILMEAKLNQISSKLRSELPIKLVGFSKGGNVLNQLVYELPLVISEEGSKLKSFFKQVKSFIWLDSGNCGHSGAWVTDQKLLQVLSSFTPQVQIHLTPYQMNDQQRPWVRKEKNKFVECLRKNKCNFKVIHYFEERLGELEDHFELLKVFKP